MMATEPLPPEVRRLLPELDYWPTLEEARTLAAEHPGRLRVETRPISKPCVFDQGDHLLFWYPEESQC
jgi:hypothetical protein